MNNVYYNQDYLEFFGLCVYKYRGSYYDLIVTRARTKRWNAIVIALKLGCVCACTFDLFIRSYIFGTKY